MFLLQISLHGIRDVLQDGSGENYHESDFSIFFKLQIFWKRDKNHTTRILVSCIFDKLQLY